MNTPFDITPAALPGVYTITPFYAEDQRGYFLKSIERDVFARFGLSLDIHEDFETYSRKDVIRGLHIQTRDQQIKIVRAVCGSVLDVVVDIRPDSAFFGKWFSIILSQDNHTAIWVPAGFAHGFRVLSEIAIVSYKCIGRFLPDFDSGIRWNDMDIAIQWGIDKPILSEKDASLPLFRDYCHINRLETSWLAFMHSVMGCGKEINT